jgi:hypothetical protein
MRRFLDRLARDRRVSTRHAVKTPLKVRLWKSATPEHAGQHGCGHRGRGGVEDAAGDYWRAGDGVEMHGACGAGVAGGYGGWDAGCWGAV